MANDRLKTRLGGRAFRMPLARWHGVLLIGLASLVTVASVAAQDIEREPIRYTRQHRET